MKGAKTKPEQDSFLYPGIDTPARRSGGVRGRRPGFAALKRCPQVEKGMHGRRIADGCRACGKVTLNGFFKLLIRHRILSLSSYAEGNRRMDACEGNHLRKRKRRQCWRRKEGPDYQAR